MCKYKSKEKTQDKFPRAPCKYQRRTAEEVRKAPLILLRFKGGWGVPLDLGLVLPPPSLSSRLNLFSINGIWAFLSLLCGRFGVVFHKNRGSIKKARTAFTRRRSGRSRDTLTR